MLKIAISKGRTERDSLKILNKAGIKFSDEDLSSRKLILKSLNNRVEIFLVKGADVPTYVEYGVADCGITGLDVLFESSRDYYEVLDLGIGKCKFIFASLPNKIEQSSYRKKRIGTKYPKVARKYFQKLGEDVEIIKIEGSVELAPLLDLSDGIVDIMESGRTLRENGLVVLDEICDISTRMIVNKSVMKFKKEEIEGLIDNILGVIEGGLK